MIVVIYDLKGNLNLAGGERLRLLQRLVINLVEGARFTLKMHPSHITYRVDTVEKNRIILMEEN